MPLHTFDHEVIDGYAGVFEMLVDKSDRIVFTPQVRLSKLFRLLVLRFIAKAYSILVPLRAKIPLTLSTASRLVPSTVPRQLPRAIFGVILRKCVFKEFCKIFSEPFSVQTIFQVHTQELC